MYDIPRNDMVDLEPMIHKCIKKYLGFSESSLFAAAKRCIQDGGDEEDLKNQLENLIEGRKAKKLSSKMWNLVEDFCMSRDILIKSNTNGGFRKRRLPTDVVDSDNGLINVKISKGSEEMTNVGMTSDQIRNMMSNTLQAINERKRELSNIRSAAQAEAKTTTQSQPLAEKVNAIAELQAKISGRLSKFGVMMPGIPPPAMVTARSLLVSPAAETGDLALKQQQPFFLNDLGRTVDASGQEIQITHHAPTLKANLRGMRRPDTTDQSISAVTVVKRSSTSKSSEFTSECESKFFDSRLSTKKFGGGVSSRHKRSTFTFNEPGKYQAEGNRLRMKAQLEILQAEIATNARKTGITSATQLAKMVPKGDSSDIVPDVEWWDALILSSENTSLSYSSPIRFESIVNLIEHPIQLKPFAISMRKGVHVAVFLTKKERKKLRRQNRREAWKEKQDKIRLGFEQPDQPKVKMSNLMRVLGNEAIQDPTKMESHVKKQIAKRLSDHKRANEERKLTAEQRKEKNARKLQEDLTGGVYVAVYKIRSLANQAKKFKVETNARQLNLTGIIALYEDVNVVVVEGGPKSQKKYRQLLMHRIKWKEEFYKEKDGQERCNECLLIWEGQTKERLFGEMKIRICPSDTYAREVFKSNGAEHYWDQSYSEAVLEATALLT